MNNLLVAQSGGPTAAINATIAGVMSCAFFSGKVDHVYGAINGIQGVLKENFVDLRKTIKSAADLSLLCQTPSAALGSCRFKLGDLEQNREQFEQIISIFRKHDIKYFIYTGGNDSMDTVDKLSAYCKQNGIDDIKVIGAPKTIDNDLVEIDHCPGFGSAAKYIATTFSELERDCHVYDTKAVTIVEVMGRNAGWLTAASALSRLAGAKGPDLIYLCETDFDTEQFLNDIRKKMEDHPDILIAVSEGIHDKNGKYISEQVQSGMLDSFGHSIISGAATVLETIVRKEIGCKVRSVELNLMQRCCSHFASATDIEESRMLGMKACQCALDGENGVMATILRVSDEPYEIKLGSVPVSEVANKEKKVPLEWINEERNDINQKLMDYMIPLIQGENDIICENGIPKHLYLY